MWTTVDLDITLLERLRIEARRRGVTFNALIATLLRRGLDAPNEVGKRYRMPTFAMGDSRRLDQALAIAEHLEDARSLR